jgi:aspartate/methionine/tyrosine aminotransferase
MSTSNRAMSSTYLEWAKLHSVEKYNLATSGIQSYPLSGLPLSLADLEINGPTVYGYEPLQQRLAQKSGVGPDCVVVSNGTSMSNHLAMAALLEPGDDVLMEFPTYGLLLEVASYLGAKIVRFDRRMENDFAVDVGEIRAKVTAKTRLIVLTNLHNPSGAFIDEGTLRSIGEIAAETGAHVLVDEVYLDMMADVVAEDVSAPPVRSCIHLGSQFVVTTSLTKAYGLSGLRCGWILAEPALAKRIWRLNDLFNATPSHPTELLSVLALDHLGQIRDRARHLLRTNRRALDLFLTDRTDLDVFVPPAGTVVFPRLKTGSVDEFCTMLRRDYETNVVPGRFFEMPRHFRIGIGGDAEMTSEGLRRLGCALDDFAGRS